MLTITLIGIGLGLLAWYFWEQISNWIDDIIEEYQPTAAELYATLKKGAKKVVFELIYLVSGRPQSTTRILTDEEVPGDFLAELPDGQRIKIGSSKK